MRLSRYIWLLLPFYVVALTWYLLHMDYQTALVLTVAPIGLLLAFSAIQRFSDFLYLMVFFVPISVGMKDLGGGLGLSFPGEAMLLVAALGTIFVLVQPANNGIKPGWHPVLLAMLAMHLWVFVTMLTSSYLEISAKFFIARSIFLLVFIVLGLRWLNTLPRINRFLVMYAAGLVIAALYSILKLSTMGLSRKYSPEMGEPFFDDHTVLGACLAMVLPFATWKLWRAWKGQARWPKGLVYAAWTILCLGLVFSFSRAAWMSVIVAIGFMLILRWRVKFEYIITGVMLLVGLVSINLDGIYEEMRQNQNVSGADVLKTAKSVTNVSSDDSNRERINRWSCAVRMARDRPLFGFGPGTYEQNYGPYQLASEKTRISTMRGDRGDSHSEYLTALSEQGYPGLMLWLLLIVVLLRSGMRVVYRAREPEIRQLGKVILLGLSTYFVHGLVNSFLDLDEAAVLFWGMSAMILILDTKFVNSPLRTLKN